jgi:hypothetical protein
MNNLIKIIGVGIAVAGVGAAFQGFTSQIDSVERKGLTVTTGVGLVVAGYLLFSKIDDLESELDRR